MEKLKEKIKCKLEKAAYEELEHNWDNICIKDLGEVIDMIKDLEKAIYYETIVKAMEVEPYSMKMTGWNDIADIEHKMPHMEANKKDHSE